MFGMNKAIWIVTLTAVASFAANSFAEPAKPIRALLVTGGCCHDYEKQKDILKQGLESRELRLANSSYRAMIHPLKSFISMMSESLSLIIEAKLKSLLKERNGRRMWRCPMLERTIRWLSGQE